MCICWNMNLSTPISVYQLSSYSLIYPLFNFISFAGCCVLNTCAHQDCAWVSTCASIFRSRGYRVEPTRHGASWACGVGEQTLFGIRCWLMRTGWSWKDGMAISPVGKAFQTQDVVIISLGSVPLTLPTLPYRTAAPPCTFTRGTQRPQSPS